MRVLVPLAEGFEELEAISVVDVLRRGRQEVVTASIGESQAVPGSHGIAVLADVMWNDLDLDDFDAIVLPGGGPGTERLMEDARVLDAVRAFDADERFVCAICAAPMVLAKAGVLEQREKTCYPTCASEVGGIVQDVPVVVDNNIITSQGPGTALLFGLVLLEHFAGRPVAEQVAAGMLAHL